MNVKSEIKSKDLRKVEKMIIIINHEPPLSYDW